MVHGLTGRGRWEVNVGDVCVAIRSGDFNVESLEVWVVWERISEVVVLDTVMDKEGYTAAVLVAIFPYDSIVFESQ